MIGAPALLSDSFSYLQLSFSAMRDFPIISPIHYIKGEDVFFPNRKSLDRIKKLTEHTRTFCSGNPLPARTLLMRLCWVLASSSGNVVPACQIPSAVHASDEHRLKRRPCAQGTQCRMRKTSVEAASASNMPQHGDKFSPWDTSQVLVGAQERLGTRDTWTGYRRIS